MKLHAASAIAVLSVMSLFQSRAATPEKPLPKAEGREKAVKGTPIDKDYSEVSFETATFGIG